MNILIDCSYIGKIWKPSDSLVIYAARLIQGFQKYSHHEIHVLIWRDKEELMDNLVNCEVNKIVLDREELTTSWRPYYRLCGFLPQKLRQEIDKRHITIVLLPFHCDVLFFYPKHIKHYAIAHDMLIYDMNKKKRGKIQYFLWYHYQNLLHRKFTRLISISKSTRDEVLERTGIESDVVYNSLPFDFKLKEEKVECISGKRYILDVNGFGLRKNTETLICAFNNIKNSVPHLLYLKGGNPDEYRYDVLAKLVAELGLEDRVIFDPYYRTEGEMRYLYSHADLFVSPSLKEGFGWTPIEAAVLKAPVLVSEIEVFKEVTCNKITMFDPHSPEDLANKMMQILDNPPSEQERTELSEFFIGRYSLKNQIMRLEELMIQDNR